MTKRRHDLVGTQTKSVKSDGFVVGEATINDGKENVVCFAFDGAPVSVILTPAKAKELHDALGLVLRSMVKPGIN